MKVRNVHERGMIGTMEVAGQLLDSLAGTDDRLWPSDQWPPMKLDGELCVGSSGGHGPVCYRVSAYDPGRKVAFSFVDSGIAAGMDGGHYFEAVQDGERVVLRHVLEATCGLGMWLHWALVIRPLHNALLEDALDRAQHAMDPTFKGSANWSPWVRVLRCIVARQNKV
jgi:hypothetical protein